MKIIDALLRCEAEADREWSARGKEERWSIMKARKSMKKDNADHEPEQNADEEQSCNVSGDEDPMDGFRRIHDTVKRFRVGIATIVGGMMVDEGKFDAKDVMRGIGYVPVETVRGIVVGLVELAHVLAIGEDGVSEDVVESLARCVRMATADDTIKNEIMGEIGYGVIINLSREPEDMGEQSGKA